MGRRSSAQRRSWLSGAVLMVASGVVVGCGSTRVIEGMSTQAATSATSASESQYDVFAAVATGDCLIWPERSPEQARIVDCTGEHRFEVAGVLDLTGEYGPDAEPPSPTTILEISQQRCEPAAREYLGPAFDPNSRFIISLLWPGEKAWARSGARRMLCGLQLPDANDLAPTFTGRVADQDQSQVWPPGTCIGIDDTTRQPTDVAVECAAPHSMEVTGTVDVGARFPGAVPAEPDQDGFIKAECTRLTDEYLAPTALRATTLMVVYRTIAQESWDAGSRRVSCSIGAVVDGTWATLLNSAKGPLLINGLPPAP